LDEELFISSATLSEYIREAERADSMARMAGEMVGIDSELAMIDMEFDVDASSSQESTLPDEANKDGERRYQREEERDEERAKLGDSLYRVQLAYHDAEFRR
jgi:hypothetical protein